MKVGDVLKKWGERLLREWIRIPRWMKRTVPLAITLVLVWQLVRTMLDFDVASVTSSDVIICLIGAGIIVFLPKFDSKR
ncbi:hypothetical protein [Exiguobacterium oxidotolerans]|uniref:Uncharacterized protein n=1 Tax=Exiguobacterium oxidotolerans TaxID=223958 RepID=A0A653IEG4_9BACL|nr:hypothetical protein [Exiguobacterium oxidotolerans]VWX37627.1 conserved hypothetical protein [Exiguobacterium oxidotolerans]